MDTKLWTDVDSYLADLFVSPDPALEAALSASEAAGLPEISVSPNQGKLLFLLAQLREAKTVLEIGTLGGYSTIWLARALPPDGRLITLEVDPQYAKVARSNIEAAGLSVLVDVRLGPALKTLPELASECVGPFDYVFIDADKEHTLEYYEWAVKLSRRGSLIIADNVVRDGEVIDSTSPDPKVQGIRRFNERVAADPRVMATAIQTVGSKGYDGMALAIVVSDEVGLE